MDQRQKEPNAAFLLKNFVIEGRIGVDTLKSTAANGLVASRIALEMLKKEGYEI